MKKKQFQTLLYSIVGVVAMFLIIVAVNVIAGTVRARADLTEENLYTLSEGTKNILKKLPGPVEIRFYVTQGEEDMPLPWKAYAQRVEDLLREYRQHAKGKVVIKKINPKPDTDAEDSAVLDGLEARQLPNGGRIYMGMAVSYADAKAAMPFLAPERERLLEYDISRAISQVASEEKQVVGVMSPLPLFGQAPNPMMMRMGQQQQQNPWIFISELQRDFDVQQVQMDVEKIDDGVGLLIVVHPRDITDKAQYAIDQFVMRGGKLVVFVDPAAIVDSRQAMGQMMPQTPGSSNLDKLLKAWGIEFDPGKVLADMTFAREVTMAQNQPARLMPTILFMDANGINDKDVVTSQLDNLLFPFAGAFSGTPAEGLTQTVLLHSTKRSQLVDGFLAHMGADSVAKDFSASDKEYSIATRLTGNFKTAYPEGKPKDAAADANQDEEKTEGAPTTEAAAEDSLKVSKETAVLLVSDVDFLADQFSVQVQPLFRIAIPINGNLNLGQNIVEQMVGDNDLIAVRSRATLNRPFTVVRDLQAEAEAKYREQVQRIQKNLQETQQKLSELQAQKTEGQRFILSPEQQAELEKFQAEEAKTKRRLREVDKELRRSIDSLETQIKVWNIFGMPLLVIAAGLAVALIKRQRTRAQ